VIGKRKGDTEMKAKVRSLVVILAILCLLTSCNKKSDVASQPPADEAETASQQTAQQAEPEESTSDSKTFDGEISLDFSYGTRKGEYSGEVNDSGLPDGTGTFSTTSSEGVAWTYEGEWDNGHMVQGCTTWEGGQSYTGEYANDLEAGRGEMQYEDGTKYEGEFSEGICSGDGTLYYADYTYFRGQFEDKLNATGSYYDKDGIEHNAKIEDGELQWEGSDETSVDISSVFSPEEFASRMSDEISDTTPYSLKYEDDKFVLISAINGLSSPLKELDLKDASVINGLREMWEPAKEPSIDMYNEIEVLLKQAGYADIPLIMNVVDTEDGTIFMTISDGEVVYDLFSTLSDKNSDTKPSAAEIANTTTLGKQNALAKANDYLSFMAFSHSGLIEQLEYEGFTTEEATYGADNCGADWNEQAARKAKNYLDVMSFSRASLIDQLKYDGFTSAQAEYGVTAAGF